MKSDEGSQRIMKSGEGSQPIYIPSPWGIAAKKEAEYASRKNLNPERSPKSEKYLSSLEIPVGSPNSWEKKQSSGHHLLLKSIPSKNDSMVKYLANAPDVFTCSPSDFDNENEVKLLSGADDNIHNDN